MRLNCSRWSGSIFLTVLSVLFLIFVITLMIGIVDGSVVRGSRHHHHHDYDDDDEKCAPKGHKCIENDDCCHDLPCNYFGWSYQIQRLCLHKPDTKLIQWKTGKD